MLTQRMSLIWPPEFWYGVPATYSALFVIKSMVITYHLSISGHVNARCHAEIIGLAKSGFSTVIRG